MVSRIGWPAEVREEALTCRVLVVLLVPVVLVPVVLLVRVIDPVTATPPGELLIAWTSDNSTTSGGPLADMLRTRPPSK